MSDSPVAPRSSHVDERGRVRMVHVGDKPPMRREAIAEAHFVAKPATIDALLAEELPKGDALAAARLAGILAAKRCDELVPLCHTIPLDGVDVSFERTAPDSLRVRATARVTARTGVEMEALVAVNVAALTLWDMAKSIDPDLAIDRVRLLEKTKRPVE